MIADAADGLFDAGSDVWHVRRGFGSGPCPVEDDEFGFESCDGLDDRGVEGRASVVVRSRIYPGRARRGEQRQAIVLCDEIRVHAMPFAVH